MTNKLNKRPYGFEEGNEVNEYTNTKWCPFGFDAQGVHKDTGSMYNRQGFDCQMMHKDTGSYTCPRGFRIDGMFWGPHPSYKRHDEEGFDMNGIHIKVNKKFAEDGPGSTGCLFLDLLTGI